MGAKEDWLWRPVLAGLCKAESIVDGSVDLEFVATLNEVLDVQQENQRRARKAAGTKE